MSVRKSRAKSPKTPQSAKGSKVNSRAAFGREVRRHRHAAKMTLEDLAQRSGLTSNYIGAIEIGKRDPSLATMTSLAQALDVPLGGLFEGVPELGPLGLLVATMFDGAPERVREGILMVLRHTATIKQADTSL